MTPARRRLARWATLPPAALPAGLPVAVVAAWAATRSTGRLAWPFAALLAAAAIGCAAAAGRTGGAEQRHGARTPDARRPARLGASAAWRTPSQRPWDALSRAASVLALWAVAAALAATLSPTTDATDSVEFQIVARTLRIAHAPGYPLYTLLGHVATWLPVGDVAWRMNLLSAAFGVVAAALALALGRRLARNPLGGVLAALWLSWTPQLWSQAVITEVYTLHMAIVLAILVCLACVPFTPKGVEPGTRWRGAALVLSGLGFTHHLTTVLLYPCVALVSLLREPRLLLRPRRVAACAAALAAGLVPLAYLPLRWRAVQGAALDAPTFLGYVTGRNYPGLLDMGRVADEPARWVLAAHQFTTAFAPAVLVAAAIGVVALARRRHAFALVLPIVVASYGAFYLGYFAWDGWVVLLPALGATAVLAAVGTAAVAGDVGTWRRPATAALAALVTAAAVARAGPQVDGSRGWSGQAEADAALALPIPAGARLVVEPAVGAGFLFARHLAGVRPDLDVVYADWPAGRAALDDPAASDRPVVAYGVPPRDAWRDRAPPRALGPFVVLSDGADVPEPDRAIGPGDAGAADNDRDAGGDAGRNAGVALTAARAGDPPWRDDVPAVRAGDGLPITLAWRVAHPPDDVALRVRWRPHAAPAATPAERALPPGAVAEARPPAQWRSGDRILDRRVAPTDLDWAPGRYSVEVGVDVVPSADAGAAAGGRTRWIPLGDVDLRPVTTDDLARDPAFADVVAVRGAAGAGVALVGVRAPLGARPGAALRVDAFWTADAAPAAGSAAAATVAALDAAPADAAPADGAAADGAAPTSFEAALSVGGATSAARLAWAGNVAAGPARAAADPGRSARPVIVTRHVITPTLDARRDRLGRAAVADARLVWRAPTLAADGGGAARGGDGGTAAHGFTLPGIPWREGTPGLDAPVRFDAGVRLAAFAPRSRLVRPGEWLWVATGWEAEGASRPRLKAFVQVLDAEQRLRASSDREILYGARPTDAWRDGERVDDAFAVRIPPDMPAGPAWLQVGLYDKSGGQRRTVVVDGRAVDDRFLTGIFVRPPDPARGDARDGGRRSRPESDGGGRRRVDVAFDGGPRLVGMRLVAPETAGADGAAADGDGSSPALTLALDWQVDAPAHRDWTVFVHVLPAAGDGAPAAQADGMPFGPAFPTRLWPAGARLMSEHRLSAAGGWPAGAVVALGLYDAATGERALPSGALDGGRVDVDARRIVVPLDGVAGSPSPGASTTTGAFPTPGASTTPALPAATAMPVVPATPSAP